MDKRGQNGTKNLKNYRSKEILKRTKALKKVLDEFEDNNVPLVIQDVAERADISVSTLGRSPYKEMIEYHLENEKIRLSPRGKREISMLLKEIRELRDNLAFEKEKNRRLLKETTFTKEILFR